MSKHCCVNLPPEAERWNGERRLEPDGWHAYQGSFWVKGRQFEVSNGKILQPQKRHSTVDTTKRDLLARLLARPDILPDSLIIGAMERNGADTAAVKGRREKAPLPDSRWFTDIERNCFVDCTDWFDQSTLEYYGKLL